RGTRERDRAALEDRHRERISLARGCRERAHGRDDRRRGMRLTVELGEDLAELAHPKLLEEETRQARRCAAAVHRVRDRAERLEAAPHRGPLVADEIAPAAGAI